MLAKSQEARPSERRVRSPSMMESFERDLLWRKIRDLIYVAFISELDGEALTQRQKEVEDLVAKLGVSKSILIVLNVHKIALKNYRICWRK